MTTLRRLACGRFDTSVSHTLEELQALAEQGQPLPLLSPAEALADWPSLEVGGDVLARLLNGVAPSLTELMVPALEAGAKVRFLSGETLVAVANFTPGGHGKRPGDFEMIKVFPIVDDCR